MTDKVNRTQFEMNPIWKLDILDLRGMSFAKRLFIKVAGDWIEFFHM